MKSAWRIIRNSLAVIGATMIYGAVSTSDYYVIELGQSEPLNLWRGMVVGVILMLPMLSNLFYNIYKESKQNDNK